MKTKLAIMLLATAACLTGTSQAFAAENVGIRHLAQETGLSERRVRMLLGARTSFAEYRYTYARSLDRFRDALGEENYQRLVRGEEIVLGSGVRVALQRPIAQDIG